MSWPRFGVGRWWIDLEWGWRVVCVALQREWHWGLDRDWYDGPHSCLWLGCVTVYWNWGDHGPEDGLRWR